MFCSKTSPGQWLGALAQKNERLHQRYPSVQVQRTSELNPQGSPKLLTERVNIFACQQVRCTSEDQVDTIKEVSHGV
jgi:hypothetical protein